MSSSERERERESCLYTEDKRGKSHRVVKLDETDASIYM